MAVECNVIELDPFAVAADVVLESQSAERMEWWSSCKQVRLVIAALSSAKAFSPTE